jgi:hypothetical protein
LCWLAPGDPAAALVEPLTERVDVIVLDGPPEDGWCAAEAAVADVTVVHPRHLDDRPACAAAVRRLALDLLDGTSAASVWSAHVERAHLLLFADENQAVVITDRLTADGVRVPPWRVLSESTGAAPLADWLYETEAEAPPGIGPAAARVDQLQAALQALVVELEERGRRLDAAEASLGEAQQRLAAREAQLQEGHAAAEEQWAGREAALQGTAQAFEQQLQQTELALQETRDRAASLETIHAVMEQERDALAAEASELRAALEAADSDADARVAAAADEAQALQARILELQEAEGTAARSSAAAEAMQARLDQAEARLKQARDAEVRAASARAESEAELSHVRTQLAELQAVAARQERRLNWVRRIPGAVWLWRLFGGPRGDRPA